MDIIIKDEEPNRHFYTAGVVFLHCSDTKIMVDLNGENATIYKNHIHDNMSDLIALYRLSHENSIESLGQALLYAARLIRESKKVENAN